MVNVHDYAHSLARALRDSPEHKALATARQRVKGNATAEQMIKDYHNKQLEMQAEVLQGKEPSQAQQEALQRLLTIIQGSADVRDYLQAEARLGTLLNDIYKILGEAVELDLIPGDK